MGQKVNFIELNGKRYDALTGVMIVGGAPKTSASRQFVDGFVRPGGDALAQPQKASKPAAPVAHAKKKPVMDVRRPSGVKAVHHAPKKSQTLMRSAVHKPEPSLKRKTKTLSHSDALITQPKFEIIKKMSHPKVDAKRLQRGALVKQSEYIRRFANPDTARAPSQPARPAAAAIKPIYASTPAGHTVAAPQAASSLDVFERALQRANSHMELPPTRTRKHSRKRKSAISKRTLGFVSTTLAVLFLAGFITLQNQANLTVKYASSKAGFAANLPAYKPAGYSVGKFTYSPGQVGVKFVNNASGQTFSVLQKQSAWNSATLHDNLVAVSGSSYKTIETAGRTIYTYGNNNATWVNGGVWYQVTTAGSLTTEELVNLATSM